jgi:hypothetical protein
MQSGVGAQMAVTSKNRQTLRRNMRKICGGIFISGIAILFSSPAYSTELSDAAWQAYFGYRLEEIREYEFTMQTPLSPLEFLQREKPKGVLEIEEKEYRVSVVVHDSGPYANKVTKLFSRISSDGLYERHEFGEEVLLVPRPLQVGQTWENGDAVYSFEGIRDLETFDGTIEDCAKITVIEESSENGEGESTSTEKYYKKKQGLIYKSATKGIFGFTKILSAYATQKEEP